MYVEEIYWIYQKVVKITRLIAKHCFVLLFDNVISVFRTI